MKNATFAALACVLVVAAAVIAAEGVRSLVSGSKQHVSLTYETLSAIGLLEPAQTEAQSGAYAPYISDVESFSALMEPLKAAGIAIGNSPFKELKTDRASMNTTTADGCIGIKPNLEKEGFVLRSGLFNPLNPMGVFHDTGAELDERLIAFFERYGTPPVTMSTNAQGERVTLPLVERPRKVLIAGDSVAFGAMIDDADTIASQLQARDGARQYVNLGVSGIDTPDIICHLEAAARRYAGQIDELVYVYCENDFKEREPFGTPEEVIGWLQGFATREGIGKVTVVFAPYIYMVAPEVTRIEGSAGARHPYREALRAALMEAVAATDFRWIDVGLLAREEQVRSGSVFGFFPLFVDAVHLSPRGTQLVADQLLAP